MGVFTLVVYLFHGFFVLGATYLGAESWAATHQGIACLARREVRKGVDLTLANEELTGGEMIDTSR